MSDIEAEKRKMQRQERRNIRRYNIENFDQDVERMIKQIQRQERRNARKKLIAEIDKELNTTKLEQSKPKVIKVKELKPNEIKKIESIIMIPKEEPLLEVIEMTGEKIPTKRSDLPRLRKKLLQDIERLRITVGLPNRSIDRMKRNAETGREPTVLKLAQELQKYEKIYNEEMAKRKK
jgi:ribosomal protein S8E